MTQRRIALTRAEADAQLSELMNGERTRWWYAFAMGHGCTIENGDDEIMQAIRDEDQLLRSILAGER